MEHIQIISRKLFLFLSILLNLNCSAQQKTIQDNYIYGNWKSVKLDTRGYQKFTLDQSQKLESSILTMERNKFYYADIGFIDTCSFYRWKTSNYDTTNLSGNILDITYKKKELAKIMVLEPVDSSGEFACFNNCALFYLKGDTLINICGGYALFLLKVKDAKSEFLPSDRDTVRCKYQEKNGECTGYIIQGTRKDGKVIHVIPVNKNVPFEQDGIEKSKK